MPKTSEAQRAAVARYNAANTTQFKIALNNKSDIDIIEHLQTKNNKQGYIKNLIREDIKKESVKE